MTSTMRVLPELRIIQQEFDHRHKRPYPGKSGRGSNSDDDDDDESQKVRKKPGRKPNPASPAVRKEQNRAAQRAFRDRKERHLQEMENTIKELKETNNDITQEARRLKSANDLLQSENFYLREVVFSFETALSKGGHVVILQEVKAELYRRHYEKHSARKLAPPPPPPTASTQEQQTPSSAAPSMFIPTSSFLPRPECTDAVSSSALQRQEFGQAVANAITITCAKSPSPPASITSLTSSSHSSTSASTLDSPRMLSRACSPVVWERPGAKAAAVVDSQEDTIFSVSSDIFYKAPSPRSFLDAYHARLARSSSPFSPITISRSAMSEQDTEMTPRPTEYTKQPTMFDELQSALFPPGTLQSLIHNNLATPQEIVNDVPLLDQLDSKAPSKDPVISSGYQAYPFSLSLMDSPCPNEPSSILEEDSGSLSTPTLGLDDGLKQEVIPSKRLQLEIRVLASAPPAVDPNIDSKVYSLPHDPRIDLIPCPRLRAQMILHQSKFDIEDLCQLLINEAICHGHPLDPHSWELPERFFDRYGFLLGQEMLRHRNKIWPKKDDPLPGKNVQGALTIGDAHPFMFFLIMLWRLITVFLYHGGRKDFHLIYKLSL
ncbi:hypothetical protein BGX29_000273 [Mortierella sp. GBA35]|nr:hypothetical protein BGX29_000273 [Mortierella sp. GBA35]